MSAKAPKVAVVGGGISGLAAALRLQELARERGLGIDLKLYESANRLGGVLSTVRREGCLLEGGPDAIFTEKPWGLDFIRKVGLAEQVIGTNPEFRTSFIALRGRLMPVPEGFYLLAPSRLMPLIDTPIFTLAGKLRMLADFVLPARRGSGDESLASFVRRRLGREALDRMAQPMVAGIYSSDPEDLSLRATFPAFLEWEKKHGSVIRGMLIHRRARRAGSERGPRYGLFVSLEDGMESLVRQAAGKLPSGCIRLGAEVRGISRKEKGFRLEGRDFHSEVDAVCLALPAPRCAGLLKEPGSGWPELLGGIPYRSGAVVNLIFREEDLRYRLDGFGFVVPAIEGRAISGCTFSSVKFAGRAPRDRVVLRAFVGGRRAEELLSRPDAEVSARAATEVRDILKISGAPLFASIHRHPAALPQYRVGHLDRVAEIEKKVSETPGLALAGNAYRGVGIPDCIRSGELAAEKIVSDLSASPPSR